MTSPRHVSASTAHDLTVPHLGFLIVNLKTPGWKREPSSDCTGSDTCNTSGSASGLGTSMSAINMVAWKWRSTTERTYCSGFMAVPLAAICRHDGRTAASVATYASKSQNFHVTSTSTANPNSMKGMVTVRAKQNGRNRILRLSCPIGVEPNHAFDPLTSIWSKCSCLAWLRTHWNKSLMGQILGVLKAATQKPCEWSSLTTTISSPEDSSLGLISKKKGMPVITVRVPTVVGTRFGQSSLLSSGMSVGSSWKHCQVGETQNRFSCDSSCASISSSLESTTVVGTGLGTQTFGWSDMEFPLRMTENSSRLHLVDMTFMQSSWTLRRSPGKPETSPKRTLARRHCRAACGTDKALPTKCHASRWIDFHNFYGRHWQTHEFWDWKNHGFTNRFTSKVSQPIDPTTAPAVPWSKLQKRRWWRPSEHSRWSYPPGLHPTIGSIRSAYSSILYLWNWYKYD